ncbi:MAG: CHC2 zinc finger domain-containing protein [Solirubrobacteraceae bacterium]
MTQTPIPQAEALRLQLVAIRGNEPSSSYFEIRGKRPGGMHQTFTRVDDIALTTRTLAKWAALSDTYVGVAPRVCQSGGADAIERVWALWSDIDGRNALNRLAEFRPLPSIVVRSGSIGSAHAYWPLRAPLSGAEAHAANRRLARHLGADMKSTDAARILRPIGSRNYKHAPSREVVCTRLELDVFDVEQVLDSVPTLPEPVPPRLRLPDRALNDDALLAFPASEYVPALTGRTVGCDGKARCPFHGEGHERTPSLHCYAQPDAGWFCFGCDRGGDIYTFAATLYGLDARGDFPALRRRLAAELLVKAVAA